MMPLTASGAAQAGQLKQLDDLQLRGCGKLKATYSNCLLALENPHLTLDACSVNTHLRICRHCNVRGRITAGSPHHPHISDLIYVANQLLGKHQACAHLH